MSAPENDTNNSTRPSDSTTGGDDAEQVTQSLLLLPEDEAAKRLFKILDQQKPLLRFRQQLWRVNSLRRRGYTNVMVRKDEDTDRWTAYAAPDAVPSPIGMNKAGRLCERYTSVMFADPPIPECTPASDSDEDRDAAEFSTRLLVAYGSEAHLNTPLKGQHAFDLASTYDSGFIRYWVDPVGNGYRLMEVIAHPTAPTLDLAVKGPDGVPYPENELKTRYVMKDGQTLTDDKAQAGEQPLPKLRSEVLTPLHVRFLPPTARDIWEARGVLFLALKPLGELRSAFADAFAKLSPDDLKKLVTSPPDGAELLLPAQARKRFKADLEKGAVTDDSLVYTISYHHLPTPTDRHGAYLCVAGDEEHALMLHRSEWFDAENSEPLDLPGSQIKQWDQEDDPWGIGAMTKLGPGNEARAYLQGTLFEQIDRTLNRKVFYPITSTFQPKNAQAQLGTYIPINPGGKPEYEDVPDLPAAVEKMYQDITDEMDDEIGLQQSAQGMNPPSVTSGKQAQQLIEQTNVGQSGPRNNMIRAFLRCWRLELQLSRAFMNAPQMISIVGDDGLYKEREWRGADLGDTKDVQLAPGSFTSLSPTAKINVARDAAQLQLIKPEDLERIIAGQVGGLIAMQDDPIRARIRRQLGAFMDGPPEELQQQQAAWKQQQVQMQAQMAMAQAVPGTVGTIAPAPQAQPPAQPSPFAQYAARIFTPQPGDDEPDVAKQRHGEIRRALASTNFSRQDPEYQQPLVAEYQRMRQAAGVLTVAEQQQAQAQAQSEKPSLSVAAKAAQLDEGQTIEVFRHAGIPLPAPVQPMVAPAQPPMPQQPPSRIPRVQQTVPA